MKTKKSKETYKKPEIKKATKMTFPTEILNAGTRIVCRQCSSCHGCR